MKKNIAAEQSNLLSQYVKLSRKLGKPANMRETRKFICSFDKLKRLFGSFSDLQREAVSSHPELEEMQTKALLHIEDIQDYRLDLIKKDNNKKNRKLTSTVSALEFLERFSENTFKGRVKPHHPPKTVKRIDRALNLVLSDLHFGADIKAIETGFLDYGPTQEARRLAMVVKQTVEYKPQYRDSTVLNISLLGDIIQHKLHDAQDAAPVSEQVCRAIHLLTQAFAQLAENFPKVVIHCATGNHGRDLNRHKERAASGKWDSLETVVYYSVKNALSAYKNIVFNIPKTPFVMYEVLGHKIFATHGDGVINPGNPGKALNIARLEQQINKINASLKDQEEVKVAIVGHTHCASVSQLSSGAIMVTNGALPPVDPFAVSLGILENNASQTLFESVMDHPVGDIRFIRVGAKEDNDNTLDNIISPWEEL